MICTIKKGSRALKVSCNLLNKISQSEVKCVLGVSEGKDILFMVLFQSYCMLLYA